MKILFLAHRIPYPPNKGDKIRSYHILRHFAQTHDVSLIYWVDDPRDRLHDAVLAQMCRGGVRSVTLHPGAAFLRGLAALATGKSFSQGFFYSRAFQNHVDDLCQRIRYDFCYVFSSPMAQYLRARFEIPTLMDFVDVDSEKWGEFARFKKIPLSWLYRLEKRRLVDYEIEVSARSRWSAFVSEAEAALFRKIGGKGHIVAVPNGVDSDLLRLPVEESEQHAEPVFDARSSKAANLVFAGTMNYFPNADAVLYFVRDILPLIRKDCPQVTFDVVGRFPPRAIRRLHGKEGVRVLGEVNDLRAHIVRAQVSVAPLRIARGIQNKVLEAMAMGVPVVATRAAVEGIQIGDADEILIGDSAATFAAHVVALLHDRHLRNRVEKKARNRVAQSYSWKKTHACLDQLIGELPGNRQLRSRIAGGLEGSGA